MPCHLHMSNLASINHGEAGYLHNDEVEIAAIRLQTQGGYGSAQEEEGLFRRPRLSRAIAHISW